MMSMEINCFLIEKFFCWLFLSRNKNFELLQQIFEAIRHISLNETFENVLEQVILNPVWR